MSSSQLALSLVAAADCLRLLGFNSACGRCSVAPPAPSGARLLGYGCGCNCDCDSLGSLLAWLCIWVNVVFVFTSSTASRIDVNMTHTHTHVHTDSHMCGPWWSIIGLPQGAHFVSGCKARYEVRGTLPARKMCQRLSRLDWHCHKMPPAHTHTHTYTKNAHGCDSCPLPHPTSPLTALKNELHFIVGILSCAACTSCALNC